MTRRLPVAGQDPPGEEDAGRPTHSAGEPDPDAADGRRLDDILRLGIPAVGALIILSAGFLAQCFGS
ncbi:MAG: hypothetical protein ACR2QM_01010 [Longimicrobiales bacterium]